MRKFPIQLNDMPAMARWCNGIAKAGDDFLYPEWQGNPSAVLAAVYTAHENGVDDIMRALHTGDLERPPAPTPLDVYGKRNGGSDDPAA